MIWVRITPINKNNKTGPHDNDINSGLTNAIIVNTTNTAVKLSKTLIKVLFSLLLKYLWICQE